jgi:Predicted integral membrane protein
MRLFDSDGPLVTAMSKFADIVLCNLMFVLFSLPVFTIGASLTALFTCMQRLIYEEDRDDGRIFLDFWLAFKRNFKQATLLWLICLLIILFLGAYYWTVQNLAGTYGKIYQVTFYFLTLIFLFGFLYVFPLQARYENTLKDTLRNAWLLSVAALPWTVLSLLLVVFAFYISFVMNPNAVAIFTYLWAVCGFALIAYLQSFFIRKAFNKLSPEVMKRKTLRAEGAVFTDEEHREQDLMLQESAYSNPGWNRREDIVGPDKPQKSRKRR